MLEATLNPSKAVSDQYRLTMLVTTDGRTHAGRILSRDATTVRIVTDLMRPSQSMTIDLTSIEAEQPVPVSTMPTGLLDPLNKDELLDLLAYLISGGDRRHAVFAP